MRTPQRFYAQQRFIDQPALLTCRHGGGPLVLTGWGPGGGGPQRGCRRELRSGRPWRSGWLSPQDHPTFAARVQPLTPLEWPMLAALSDQPTGVMPAGTPVWPARRY